MPDPRPRAKLGQPRSEQRRRLLVEAALRLIERDGLEGVTHRRVGAEAGVPVSALAYYFATRDDLLLAGMERLVEREAERLGEIAATVSRSGPPTPAATVEALVAVQAELLRDHRPAQIAQLELYLRVARGTGAARSPRWTAAYVDVAARLLAELGVADPQAAGELVVAAVTGLMLTTLTQPVTGPPEAALREPLSRLLAGLIAVG